MKITNLLKGLILLLLIGTSSCCQDIDCSTGRLNVIGFIGFGPHDLDNAVIRRFPQGSTYQIQNKIDSFLLLANSSVNNISNDTANISISDMAPFAISPGFKYQIYVPATADSATIDSVIDKQTQLEACSGSEFTAKSCDNPLVGIYVNGAPISGHTSYQIIYVTK
jgi:hypothetical protein